MRKQGIFELLALELGKVLNRGLLFFGFSWRRTLRKDQIEWFIGPLRPVASGHALRRVGGPNAGGLLLPDDLQGIAGWLSTGLSHDGLFEADLARLTGVAGHIADPGIKDLPAALTGSTLTRRQLSQGDVKRQFNLETWLAAVDAPTAGDMILRLDIAWRAPSHLVQAPNALLRRFRIIVVRLANMDQIVQPKAAILMWPVFAKLLTDFAVVHIHADNRRPLVRARGIAVPTVMEFTFLRRDRLREGGPDPVFPHPLDAACDPSRKDIVLPALWQKPGR